MRNLWQKGNSVTTDSAGSITGLYLYLKASNAVNAKIDSCRFYDMHCFDQSATTESILFEDVAGIFVSSQYQNSNKSNNMVEVSNIYGYDFGKRLVKTDCAHVTLRNILGENTKPDFYCLVGLNATSPSKKYAYLENIHHKGIVANTTNMATCAVVSAMEFTTINNLTSEVNGVVPWYDNNNNIRVSPYYPIITTADNILVKNLRMIGAQTIYLTNQKNIKFENILYYDVEGPNLVYGKGVIMPALNACAEISGLRVKAHYKTQLIMSNYSGDSENDISIIDSHIEFTGSSNSKIVDGSSWDTHLVRLNLTLRNCVYVATSNVPNNPIKNCHGRWILDNVTFVYNMLSQNSSSLCGEYYAYNDPLDSLTLHNITLINNTGNASSSPAIILRNGTDEEEPSKVSLYHLHFNGAAYGIDFINVFWDEYTDASVCNIGVNNLYRYSMFGSTQKGFVVKQYNNQTRYKWNGQTWITLD